MEKIYAYCPIPVNKIFSRAVIVLCILSVLLVTTLINPEKTELPACQFKRLTGYSCPTCGLTRSFHAFSHMNFRESFGFHPLGPVIYAGLLLVLIKFSFEIAAGKEIRLNINHGVAKLTAIFFFCTLFFFWMIRFIHELR